MSEVDAYHESGHGYMAVRVGARVLSMTIEPDWDDGPARVAEIQIAWPEKQRFTKTWIDKQLLVIFAGPSAEMIYSGEKFHPGLVAQASDDWRQAWDLAAHVVSDDRQRLKYLESLCAGVYETLSRNEHWAAVAALADNLLAHETLEGDEVVDIVRQWIP